MDMGEEVEEDEVVVKEGKEVGEEEVNGDDNLSIYKVS